MEKNKTGKYLKYAIGEIILVVFGILIALQINNWNEINKLNKKTNTFLQNLKSDLENDYKQINGVINLQSKRISFVDSILKISQHKTNSLKILKTGRNETFFPLAGSYKSGSEEGLISNIKNEELRLAIINLYELHYIRLQYNGELNDQRHESIEWNSRNYINHEISGLNFTITALENQDFLNQLKYLNKFTKIYTDRANSIRDVMESILVMIEVELGEKR